MSLSLNILTEASGEIKEITAWYKDISKLLAAGFVSQLYDGFAKITTTPETWFNLTKRIRRYKLPDFPYIILFFIDDDKIIVFAVIHEKRNPKTWKRRIRRK